MYLKHYGVKGMKWGVIRNGRIGQTVKSIKRERSWKKALKNMDSKSNEEISKLSNRIQLENDLKRLSKKRDVGGKQDKTDYLNRDRMSDKELLEKVSRLRVKDNLVRNVNEATKSQSELGRKMVQVASVVGIGYATSGRLSTRDIGMAAINPTGAYNAMKDKQIKKLFEDTNIDLIR